MMRILAKNVVSSYGKKQVLKGVTLSADAGQCVGIVGENGCGKSTLLNILAGLKKADSGEVSVDYAGYVPQEGNLIDELNVLDNLSLWYRDKAQLRYSLEQGFLKALGVDKMCRMQAGKLSGGMKKRVSIGCALAGNPSVLLLDEPSSALDLMGRADIRRYLVKYKELGGTILIATHEESDLELCDKVYALHDGKSREIDRFLRGEELIDQIGRAGMGGTYEKEI